MYKYFKRIIDVVLSIMVLFIISPLFIIVPILIKIDSKGPVFFKQNRIGINLKLIYIYKFRTMTNEEHVIFKKPIIGRGLGVTKLGYFLRRFKIDELPQLLNVINGELSLVGPRPSVESHLLEMSSDEKKRYEITPGLTGLAQVSGNIHVSWKQRYKLDLLYRSNITLGLDFRILKRTFLLLIVGEKYFVGKPLKL